MKKISENLILRVISIIVALLLWLLVVNISKPEIQVSQTVQIGVEGEEIIEREGKKGSIDKNTVTIHYTVRSDQNANIKKSDFTAYVNLADYDSSGFIPIRWDMLNQEKKQLIQNVYLSPQVVHVTLEDIKEKEFNISARTNGMVEQGFILWEISVYPKSISIIGPESEIERVAEIGIEVDIERLKEDMSSTAEPVFYDEDGNILENLQNVSPSSDEISYSVAVYKRKQINILSSVEGNPAEGYQYESSTVSPQSVEMCARADIIDKLKDFTLPSIDIENATGNLTRSFELEKYLPKNVFLTGQDQEVNVSVRIEKIPEVKMPHLPENPGNPEYPVAHSSQSTQNESTASAAETESTQESANEINESESVEPNESAEESESTVEGQNEQLSETSESEDESDEYGGSSESMPGLPEESALTADDGDTAVSNESNAGESIGETMESSAYNPNTEAQGHSDAGQDEAPHEGQTEGNEDEDQAKETEAQAPHEEISESQSSDLTEFQEIIESAEDPEIVQNNSEDWNEAPGNEEQQSSEETGSVASAPHFFQ